MSFTHFTVEKNTFRASLGAVPGGPVVQGGGYYWAAYTRRVSTGVVLKVYRSVNKKTWAIAYTSPVFNHISDTTTPPPVAILFIPGTTSYLLTSNVRASGTQTFIELRLFTIGSNGSISLTLTSLNGLVANFLSDIVSVQNIKTTLGRFSTNGRIMLGVHRKVTTSGEGAYSFYNTYYLDSVPSNFNVMEYSGGLSSTFDTSFIVLDASTILYFRSETDPRLVKHTDNTVSPTPTGTVSDLISVGKGYDAIPPQGELPGVLVIAPASGSGLPTYRTFTWTSSGITWSNSAVINPVSYSGGITAAPQGYLAVARVANGVRVVWRNSAATFFYASPITETSTPIIEVVPRAALGLSTIWGGHLLHDGSGDFMYSDIATSPSPTVYGVMLAQQSAPPNPPTGLAVSNNSGQPTLSWTFNDPDSGDTQSAYQAICERWNGSAWVAHFDTGKVTSATSSHALTVGQRLNGATTYRFRVRTWDASDADSPYSTNFSWATTSDVYEATGSYTTEVIQLDREGFVQNGSLSWTQATPTDTSLTVSVRTTEDGFDWTGWSVITSPYSLPPVKAVQLKFDMATSYNLSAPTFSGISVSFPQEYNEAGSYISTALNVEASVVESYGGQAVVDSTVPAGTSIVSEYAGSVDGIAWGAWTAFPVTYHPYIRYRITLNANATRSATPTLSTITTDFWTKYEAQGSLQTLPVSLRDYIVTSLIPSWASALNSGTIQVEAAVSEDNVAWGPWFAVTAAQELAERDMFVKFRITLTSDATGEFTPTMSSMSVAAVASAFRGFWQSPILDVSNATSQDSGIASMVQSTPGASRVLLYSRSSPDQVAWTAWFSATAQGELQHPAGDYVEILVQFDPDNDGERPSLYRLAVSFDGEASVQLLSDQFSPGGQFHFAQLLDYATITNGIDVPQKYDGDVMTELGGEPPRGFFVAAHKNRMWMLRGSRLYFTELIDIEDWPILNFIDISPNDGDEGTALYPSGDYLIIAKKHSIWLLVGDSYDTFSVRRLSAARGCIAPRSITMMDEVLVFVSDDGIYFSDFAQTVLASERLRKTWDTLNHRRLNQAVSWFAKQKLYVSLPSAGQPVNDTVLVYDALRKAWYVMSEWNVSCATSWIEAGQQVWLVGHSDEGQVSQIDIGRNNNGNPIEGLWESRYFDARMPEIVKRFRRVEIMVTPAIQPVTLEVQFCQDGGEYSAPVTMTVPGRHDRRTEILQLDPARSGIFYGRSIGMRVRQATMDAGVGIVAVNLSFYPLQERPTIRS